MSARRALVHCAVLSLQDTCVFYPCCKGCFSRIDADQQDTTRYKCSRCGYRCLREQVEYRYRLSLRVTRERCIFGVTVFGNSLNQFFGINASGLQKLVELEPSSSTLLVKAVKDCFIGRHFIFGIKLSGTESGHLFEELRKDGSNMRGTSKFVASQMILPQTAGLSGCSVVRYYQTLLRKASELEPDASNPCRLYASTLLLDPSQSPTSSFSTSPLFASGLISQSLLRSKHQDDTLSLTPPWQQSLGLVTSSVEQEEGCSTQDSGEVNSRHKDTSTVSVPAESHNVAEETEKIPPLPLKFSFYDYPSFSKKSNSSVRNVVGNIWCSPSQPGQKSCSLTQKVFNTGQHTSTLSSNSFLWEDLPFSESLSEFLCEENKNVDVFGKTEPNPNCQKKRTETFLEDSKGAGGLAAARQRKVQVTSNSPRLLDAIADPSADVDDGCDSSDQLFETPMKCRNRHAARSIVSNEDDKGSLCFEEEEEKEQHEGNSYNCSADLFGNSYMISMNTETLNVDSDILKPATNTGTAVSMTDGHHLINKRTSVGHFTPHNPEGNKTARRIRNSLIPQESHDFEFVPPSQSTPLVKVHLPQSPSSSENLTAESTKENLKFRKPDKHKTHLQVGHRVKLQRRNLNLESKRVLQARDETFCNLEDDEGIVAPTPAGKTQLSASLRRKRRADMSSRDLGSSWKACPEDGSDCKSLILEKTFTSLHGSLLQDVSNQTALGGTLDGSNGYLVDDENHTRDWSRDLFSDSI